MRFIDLLKMSFSSLLKRKVRSILTILGVVVGTASIIVMISIGLGLQKTTEDTLASSFSLTTISVSDFSKQDEGLFHLTESSIKELENLDHVVAVNPSLSFSAYVFCGQYTDQMYIQCVPADFIEERANNYGSSELKWGELPKAGEGMKLVVSSYERENFMNKAGRSFYETNVLPEFDYQKDTFKILYDTSNYQLNGPGATIVEPSTGSDSSGGSGGDTAGKLPPRKYPLEISGEFVESYANYAPLEEATAMLKKAFKGKVIPGQPTQKNGKPYSEIYYDEAFVSVDDMDNVVAVMEEIKNKYNLQAYSNTEYLNDMQKQNKSVQNMLGAIGFVSLVVAAIGIANTMMMSIYERTKEIGVMKVLGCTLSNIRSLFLLEAAYIGLIGGVIGILVSYLISYILNNFSVNLGLGNSDLQYWANGVEKTTSYIPPYLSIGGLIFAIIIGIVSGFFPARRAMKLSPLAAIRNE